MNTNPEPTVTNLAAGEGIKGIIDNITGTGQMIGGSVAILMVVVLGIMIAFSAAGQGGIKKSMGGLMALVVACLVMGGGTAVAPMLIDTGDQVTDGTSGDTGGVN